MRRRDTSPQLQVHPRARSAFEALAGLLPPSSLGMPRAVRGENALLVFTGFGALDTPPIIERGLTGDEIEAAAWAEVRAVWQLLTAPPVTLRRFGLAVAATAPDALLQEIGLPPDRDSDHALKRLPLASRARQEPRRDTAFARARARYRMTASKG